MFKPNDTIIFTRDRYFTIVNLPIKDIKVEVEAISRVVNERYSKYSHFLMKLNENSGYHDAVLAFNINIDLLLKLVNQFEDNNCFLELNSSYELGKLGESAKILFINYFSFIWNPSNENEVSEPYGVGRALLNANENILAAHIANSLKTEGPKRTTDALLDVYKKTYNDVDIISKYNTDQNNKIKSRMAALVGNMLLEYNLLKYVSFDWNKNISPEIISLITYLLKQRKNQIIKNLPKNNKNVKNIFRGAAFSGNHFIVKRLGKAMKKDALDNPTDWELDLMRFYNVKPTF
jgi:hypothetical protein